jgi:hypothetical protein
LPSALHLRAPSPWWEGSGTVETTTPGGARVVYRISERKPDYASAPDWKSSRWDYEVRAIVTEMIQPF